MHSSCEHLSLVDQSTQPNHHQDEVLRCSRCRGRGRCRCPEPRLPPRLRCKSFHHYASSHWRLTCLSRHTIYLTICQWRVCQHNETTLTRLLQRTCINSMLGIANSQFGCGQGDVLCYCREPNFGYGVRDCANEACGSNDASTVIAFGTQYCQSKFISSSFASITLTNMSKTPSLRPPRAATLPAPLAPAL